MLYLAGFCSLVAHAKSEFIIGRVVDSPASCDTPRKAVLKDWHPDYSYKYSLVAGAKARIILGRVKDFVTGCLPESVEFPNWHSS